MRFCNISIPSLLRASARRAATVAFLTLPVVFTSTGAAAQAAADAKPGVDVITFNNGDRLTGTLLSESGGTVVFHSDMSGDIKVERSKIQSLRTGEKFAVIPPDTQLKMGKPTPQVAVGTIEESNDQVSVSGVGGEIKNVPTKEAGYLVNGDEFTKTMAGEPSLMQGWNGGITLGATLVQATQTSQTFTGAAALVRTVPSVDWLAPRNKTIFDASATYGLVTQPFIAGVQDAASAKTNILHGDIERDQYVTSRLYYLFDASADHNIGSGLRVQQVYGAGAGYSVIRQPKRTFDVKGDIHYSRQEFYPAFDFPSGKTLNLIGATIGELYMQKLPRGLVFNEAALIQPAFNTPEGQPSAYTAQIIAGLLFPVYKNFGFTIGSQDNFINNPPFGYKKNTFQFTAGVTYTIK